MTTGTGTWVWNAGMAELFCGVGYVFGMFKRKKITHMTYIYLYADKKIN